MSDNTYVKVFIGIALLVVLLCTVGFVGTIGIGIAALIIVRLIEVKTFIKWLLLGVACAFLGATPLFYICVIVGGVLWGKEMNAKIDEEFDKRDSQNK